MKKNFPYYIVELTSAENSISHLLCSEDIFISHNFPNQITKGQLPKQFFSMRLSTWNIRRLEWLL